MKKKLKSTIMGDTAKELRERFGKTQIQAAKLLAITQVHLCNIETGKAMPSFKLVERYRVIFGVDLYVYAWVTRGNHGGMPLALRMATRNLENVWRSELGRTLGRPGSITYEERDLCAESDGK